MSDTEPRPRTVRKIEGGKLLPGYKLVVTHKNEAPMLLFEPVISEDQPAVLVSYYPLGALDSIELGVINVARVKLIMRMLPMVCAAAKRISQQR